jgi:hypothetical protein
MIANKQEPVDVLDLHIDLTKIPPLLSVEGVNQHIAPLSRSLLYEADARGEIQSASVGIGRGRRLFLASSIVDWLQRRAAKTLRPNIAPRSSRKRKGKGES